MIRSNLVLLPNMSGKITHMGEPTKAVGYYSYDTNKRLNTISIHTIKFTGRIYIYGTLKTNPTEESDWAIIPLTDETDYIEFNNFGKPYSKRENIFVNIEGGYTYLKAKMDRDYLNVIKTPVEINYRPSQGTHGRNIINDESIPMSNKMIKVKRDVNGDLINYGNITSIMLCY